MKPFSVNLKMMYQEAVSAAPIPETPALMALPTILEALNWGKSPILLTQHLSQFQNFEFEDLIILLKGMGYYVTKDTEKPNQVLLEIDNDKIQISKNKKKAQYAIRSQTEVPPGSTWFKEMLRAYRAPIKKIFLVSFWLNVFLLAIPILTKQVYDKVIGSYSYQTLFSLSIGAVILLALIYILRSYRSKLTNYLSNLLTYNAQYQVMHKLVSFPLLTLTQSSFYGHLMRIKGLEQIKELSTGSIGKALIDLPFVIMTLIVIAIVGHVLVVIPIISMILFYFIGKAMNRMLLRSQSIDGVNQRRRQSLFIDFIEHADALRDNEWLLHYQDANLKASRSHYYHNLRIHLVQVATQSLGNFTALATLTVGILLVLDGVITAGGLIASMMLVWRVVAPIQMSFSALLKVDNLNSTLNQLDKIMVSKSASEQGKLFHNNEVDNNDFSLDQVSFRYDYENPSAILGVSADFTSKSRTVIIGEKGAGKTTLIRLMAGLLTPQTGRVILDGVNQKQFDAIDYNNEVMVFEPVPLRSEPTILQHAQVYLSGIPQEVINHQFQRACTFDDALKKIKSDASVAQNAQFVGSDKIGYLLNLMRILTLKPKVVLIDDVDQLSNHFTLNNILQMLSEFQKNSTVIYVCNHQRWFEGATHIMSLDKGQCQYYGPIQKQE